MTYTVEPITDRGETRYVVRDEHGIVVNGVKHKTRNEAEFQKTNLEAFMRGMANQRGRG